MGMRTTASSSNEIPAQPNPPSPWGPASRPIAPSGPVSSSTPAGPLHPVASEGQLLVGLGGVQQEDLADKDTPGP